MAIGIIIMGFGFLFMVLLLWNLRNQVLQAWYGFSLFISYHWELCLSVALSFITKLSPVKYASLMMGVYFAATGLE
jgi:POT family proton-dependent oligopeptide transporter